MARRDYAGNAAPTTLTADIGPTDLAISIAGATGWPSGGGAGKFFITIDRGLSNEERVLVASRTGTGLTVALLADRGVDDTIPAIHSAGAVVEHTFSGVDADEANRHINDPAQAETDHSTLLNNTRHDVEARHQFGDALGTPGLPSLIGTSAATGTGDDPAREDHVHALGIGSIYAAALFAAGVVDNAAIGNAAVGTAELGDASVIEGKLADGAVTTPKIADLAVTLAKLAALSVSTAKIQDDAVTSPKIADGNIINALLANGAVTNDKIFDNTIQMAKTAVQAPTTFVPVIGGLTGGSNTVTGSYFKAFGLILGIAQFTIGAGGDINNTITCTLPTVCRAGGNDWFAAIRGLQGVDGATGMGIVEANTQLAINFRTIGVGVWDANSPFAWGVGGSALIVFCYASAT